MSGDESSVRETPRPLLHGSRGAQKTRASGPRAPPSTSADGRSRGRPSARAPAMSKSLLALAGRPEPLPVRHGSGSSKAPRVRGQPQGLFTVSSPNGSNTRGLRTWAHPRACGNPGSSAPVEGPAEGPARLPRGEAAPAPLQPQGLARRRFLLEALSQACPLTEPSQSRLGIPGPPARWLSLAADRHLTFLRSQPRCPLPGLHTGQLSLLCVPGLWSKGGVPRGPLCLQPMGPMPLGPQSQVTGLEVQPGPLARPASGLWRHLPLATAHSPECAPVRGKEQAHGKKLSFKQSRRLGGGSGHVL